MATTDVHSSHMSDTTIGRSNPELEVVDIPGSDLDRPEAPRRCSGREDDRIGRNVRPEPEPWAACRSLR
jgi:hypothetical protein